MKDVHSTSGATKTNTGNSAKPGTKGAVAGGGKPEKPKKDKVVRVPYPGLKDATGNDQRLEAVPTDFDHKNHLPLTRKDFKDESVFFVMKADAAEKTAKRYRQMAEDSKKLGGVKDKGNAKRLIAMQRRMAEIKAQLTAQGIDVNALLAASEGEATEGTPAAQASAS